MENSSNLFLSPVLIILLILLLFLLSVFAKHGVYHLGGVDLEIARLGRRKQVRALV